MKKIFMRMIKFTINEMRKILADISKNRNLKTDAYLYDMSVNLKRDLSILRRESQYILHVGNKPICIINESKAISVLDRKRFDKIKIALMKLGSTPIKAYNNIDGLFSANMFDGKKPIAVTIKR